MGNGQRGIGVSLDRRCSPPPQVWTETCIYPVLSSGPNHLSRDSEDHFTMLCTQPVCKSRVWRLGVRLCEVVSIPVCPGGFCTQQPTAKSQGTRTCFDTCLSNPRRLYLTYSYFCFVYTIFTLATVFISDLGILLKCLYKCCVIIFPEGVSSLYLSMEGTTLFHCQEKAKL